MFQFHRPPITPEGQRLYYRRTPKYDPERFNPTMPLNILIQFRLYRMSFLGYNEIQRRWLMAALFSDTPIHAQRVGNLLKVIMPYGCGSTKNNQTRRYWRFVSHLDLQYALEYLMLRWITDERLVGRIPQVPNRVEDQASYEGVLERIRKQSDGDDLLALYLIHPKWDHARKGHGVHWNKDCLLRP